MGFKNFPIVDAVLARLAGVADHDAALEFIEIHAQLYAALAARREFYGRGATERGRIMVLRAGGDVDDDGFGVAADVDPVFLTLTSAGKAIKRGANGHRHRAGATDARARGSFRIGRQGETAVGPKKLHDFREERQAITPRF